MGHQNKLPFKCNNCQSKGHVSPMCNNGQKKGVSLFNHVCANADLQHLPFIFADIALTFGRSKWRTKIKCHRFYFAKKVAQKLKYTEAIQTPVDFEVKTFLGASTKKLKEMILEIEIKWRHKFSLPILLDDDFKFHDFGKFKTNLSKLNYKLAFLSNDKSDQIKIHSFI